MIEHYLTVTVLKKAFIDFDDGGLNFIGDGLNPVDADNFNLQPIISVMLTVAKHGIHYQRLYRFNSEICLVDFLAKAWSQKVITGLPDVLTISPELEDFYNLSSVLSEIDPEGIIRLNIVKNQSYAASLRYAQENVRSGICENDTSHTPPFNSDDAINLANLTLERMSAYIDPKMAIKSTKPLSLMADSINKAHFPRIFNSPLTFDWLMASADKVPLLEPGTTLRYYNNDPHIHSCLFISADNELIAKNLREEHISLSDLNSDDRRVLYADQLTSEFSALACRIKDYAKDFADIITEDRLEQVKKLNLPVAMATYEAIMERMREHPSVFFPKNAKEFESAFDYLETQEPKCIVELTGVGNTPWQYRIFAIMDIYDRTNLVVVDQKFRFRSVPNPTCCTFSGPIDVGPGAMAAINFQLNNLRRFPSSSQTNFYTISIGLMLDQYPIWRNEREEWYEPV